MKLLKLKYFCINLLAFAVSLHAGCASGSSGSGSADSANQKTEYTHNFIVVLSPEHNEKDLLSAFSGYKIIKFSEMYSEKHYNILIKTAESEEEVIEKIKKKNAIRHIEAAVSRHIRRP